VRITLSTKTTREICSKAFRERIRRTNKETDRKPIATFWCGWRPKPTKD
jgi:hypothetical protein